MYFIYILYTYNNVYIYIHTYICNLYTYYICIYIYNIHMYTHITYIYTYTTHTYTYITHIRIHTYIQTYIHTYPRRTRRPQGGHLSWRFQKNQPNTTPAASPLSYPVSVGGKKSLEKKSHSSRQRHHRYLILYLWGKKKVSAHVGYRELGPGEKMSKREKNVGKGF